MISRLRMHPILTLGAGMILGYVFAKQIGSVPGVSRIPQKS